MQTRKLYHFKEAAEKFYGGDEETLRHALLLGVVRARVELCETGTWVWWVEGDDEASNPQAGHSDEARWTPVRPAGTYQLTGWFYLDRNRASRIAHGRLLSDLLVSVDEEEEHFLGLTFQVRKLIDLNALWFEPSAYPERVIGPEDEALDEMAHRIPTLTNDTAVIARFQAAANAGSEGFDFESLDALTAEYYALERVSFAKAAMALVREEQRQLRAKGGMTKSSRSPTALMKKEIRAAWDAWQCDRSKYRFPRDFRRAMLLKFPDAVDGTIKNWMSEWGRGDG